MVGKEYEEDDVEMGSDADVFQKQEGAVDFGWEEPAKKVTGRRKKTLKKPKLGTFGASCIYWNVCTVG